MDHVPPVGMAAEGTAFVLNLHTERSILYERLSWLVAIRGVRG